MENKRIIKSHSLDKKSFVGNFPIKGQHKPSEISLTLYQNKAQEEPDPTHDENQSGKRKPIYVKPVQQDPSFKMVFDSQRETATFIGNSQRDPFEYLVIEEINGEFQCKPVWMYNFTPENESLEENQSKRQIKTSNSHQNLLKKITLSNESQRKNIEFKGSEKVDELLLLQQDGRNTDEIEQTGELIGGDASDDEIDEEAVPLENQNINPFRKGYEEDFLDKSPKEDRERRRMVKKLVGKTIKKTNQKNALLSDVSEESADSESSSGRVQINVKGDELKSISLQTRIIEIIGAKGQISAMELVREVAKNGSGNTKKEIIEVIKKVAVMKTTEGQKRFELKSSFAAKYKRKNKSLFN